MGAEKRDPSHADRLHGLLARGDRDSRKAHLSHQANGLTALGARGANLGSRFVAVA